MLSALKENHDLYMNAYNKILQSYLDNPEQPLKPLMSKMIVYGVKAINSKPEPEYVTREEAEYDFNFADCLMGAMSTLKPAEFINLFPIEKDYKGHRWGMKDYFYTRNYIKTLDKDKPIGEKIHHFLWEYTNWEITEFNVQLMEYMSRLRRLDGKPSLAQEWAEMNGLKVFNMYTDDKGTQYLLDPETRKTTKVKPAKRRHLKIAK